MEFSNESSLRTQGPQRERKRSSRRRGLSLRHSSRGLFSLFEARGCGSLRSQGRPGQRLYEATAASTYGSIQSYAIALPAGGERAGWALQQLFVSSSTTSSAPVSGTARR